MKLVSLAPRYIGDFEKGVDYKGDVAALERSLRDHAAIAEMLGPYKLSLHSGSDKLSMYPALARATQGPVPRQDGRDELPGSPPRRRPPRRRRCSAGSSTSPAAVTTRTRRPTTSRPRSHSAPPAAEVSDAAELERHYLEHWSDVPRGQGFTRPGRQILHCTFGSVLTDPRPRPGGPAGPGDAHRHLYRSAGRPLRPPPGRAPGRACESRSSTREDGCVDVRELSRRTVRPRRPGRGRHRRDGRARRGAGPGAGAGRGDGRRRRPRPGKGRRPGRARSRRPAARRRSRRSTS